MISAHLSVIREQTDKTNFKEKEYSFINYKKKM